MYRRILKSLVSVGFLLAMGLWFGSCDQGVTGSKNQETAPINLVAYAVGVPVSTLVVEVTGEGIKNRLVFNLTFNEDFVASGIIEVPIGEQRLFSVTTYDDQHNVTHTGEAIADVSSKNNPPLQIKLKPELGQVEIMVSLGDYAVIVSPAAATIDASGGGTTAQLAVTVYDQYGEEVLDPQAQWATTHPTLATVSTTGLVTGFADGQATIVATYGGVAGMSEVTLINFGGGGVECLVDLDCPGSAAPMCSQVLGCQGYRVDAVCLSGICSTVQVDDDSACDASLVGNTCGFYLDLFCSGAVTQDPICPSSCVLDDECDPEAHCDDVCMADLPPGSGCDENSDCISGNCSSGICVG